MNEHPPAIPAPRFPPNVTTPTFPGPTSSQFASSERGSYKAEGPTPSGPSTSKSGHPSSSNPSSSKSIGARISFAFIDPAEIASSGEESHPSSCSRASLQRSASSSAHLSSARVSPPRDANFSKAVSSCRSTMMKHPHSAAASLTFMPPAPMAFASSKRLTYATNLLMRRTFPRSSNEPAASICVTRCMTAGNRASATNASGSSRHGKI
mmetsp:Transcript_7844/g.33351  ORF Transcript_7844/g.33351 Transcript_7844/m.33351 type:complete len:209 (+) Transcript_7844:325-951(+)